MGCGFHILITDNMDMENLMASSLHILITDNITDNMDMENRLFSFETLVPRRDNRRRLLGTLEVCGRG